MTIQGTPPSPAVSAEALVRSLYEFAARMMKAGSSDWQISKALVEKGLNPEQAQIVIRRLREARADVFRKAGMRDMLIGGGICVLGGDRDHRHLQHRVKQVRRRQLYRRLGSHHFRGHPVLQGIEPVLVKRINSQ